MKTRIFFLSIVMSVSVVVATDCFAGDEARGNARPSAGVASDDKNAQDSSALKLWETDPVLQKLVAFYKRTTDFSAKFKQVVRTKSPKRTFKRGGSVFFKRPGLMRWDYSVPDAVYYVSDGTILWAYDAEDRSAVKMKVADSELYSSLGFLSGTSSLSETFVPDVAKSDTPGFSVVTLVPLEADGNYRSLTLTVNEKTGEVAETEIVDPVGNRSRIRFETHNYSTVPNDAFQFKVPRGVRVQDLTTPGATEKDGD